MKHTVGKIKLNQPAGNVIELVAVKSLDMVAQIFKGDGEVGSLEGANANHIMKLWNDNDDTEQLVE